MEGERVVVIGGGIIGTTTAFMLKYQNPNLNVLLLDKSPDVAADCSHQNGGVLTYSFHHPWTRLQFLWTGFKGMFSSESCSTIGKKAFWNFNFWVWNTRLLFSSLFQNYNQKEQDMHLFGKRSYLLHENIRKDLSKTHKEDLDSYLGKDDGLLDVMTTVKSFQSMKKWGLELNHNHEEKVRVHSTRQTCAEGEPNLKDWRGEIVGCIKNELETQCAFDSYSMTRAFANISAKLGVEILYNAEVVDFKKEGNKVTALALSDGKVIVADKFVICSGVHSRELGSKLGWAVPVWPAKGYSFNVQTNRKLKTSIHYGGANPFYLCPVKQGIRYSGIVEFTTIDDKELDPKKVEYMQRTLKDMSGWTDLKFENNWVCLRPVSCDDMPIIGKFPKLDNVFVNTGHGSRGCIFAFSSAELLSQLVQGKVPITNPTPYSPSRFYL